MKDSALIWWRDLTFEQKFFRTIEWLSSQNRDTTERHPDHLKDSEIEEIYKLFND